MSGEVQVLTDTYGRIFTQHDPDGDVRTAVVWVPGDSRIDWDDASDQELVTLLGKYGYNDALTIENNNVTINDNEETETLIWDSAAMDFTVDVDMFVNGAQNMYFRTVNDGSQDVTVLVDADGKAIVAPTLGEYSGVLFSVDNNGTEIDTITADSSISAAAVIEACGGSVNVTALEAGASVFLLVMGTHVQFCNADNLSTTPSVVEWVDPYRAVAPFYTKEVEGNVRLLDKNGRVITFDTGSTILNLMKYDGDDFFIFNGQPLSAEKTTPLTYVSDANVYEVVDGTITQTADQHCTTNPTPVPWND
mgnify:CR=1 FL=1